jgi:hypothetical protein
MNLQKVLIGTALVTLPIGGFFIGYKNNPTKVVVERCNACPTIPTNAPETKTNGWVKPVSTEVAIPVLKDSNLYTYSLTRKQLMQTEYKSAWGGGAMGFGEDTPLASPDGKIIAFINQSDLRKLYIIANGNPKAIKVTDYPVDYINSWSGDSSKVLFYTGTDNMVVRKEPQGMGESQPWEINNTFTKGMAPGFHSFDVGTGTDTYLYPLVSAEKFIDNNRILVEQNKDNDARYVLFNVDTFESDYTTVNYPLKSASRQNTFTADGKFWSRTTGESFSGGNVNIVYAKFPDAGGDVVETGAWAFVQRPLLSADGKFLAYTRRGEKIAEGRLAGQYKDKTIIWDTNLKRVVKELDGMLIYWLNNNVLVIGRADYGNNIGNYTSFDLYNANSQTIESVQVK